jgi:hypothetical protein
VKILVALLASALCALGANPYLHLPDYKQVTLEFMETQWDAKGGKSKPAKALVTMQRIHNIAPGWNRGENLEVTVDSSRHGTFKLFFSSGFFSAIQSDIVMDNEDSIRAIDKLIIPLRPVLNHTGVYLGGMTWITHRKRKPFGDSSTYLEGDKLYQFQKGVGLVAFGHKKSVKYPACSWVLKEQATTKTNNLWRNLLGETETKTVPFRGTPKGQRHEAYRPISP